MAIIIVLMVIALYGQNKVYPKAKNENPFSGYRKCGIRARVFSKILKIQRNRR